MWAMDVYVLYGMNQCTVLGKASVSLCEEYFKVNWWWGDFDKPLENVNDFRALKSYTIYGYMHHSLSDLYLISTSAFKGEA